MPAGNAAGNSAEGMLILFRIFNLDQPYMHIVQVPRVTYSSKEKEAEEICQYKI